MRIILISADDDAARVLQMTDFLRKHYNIHYVFSMDNKRSEYTKKLVEKELNLKADVIKHLSSKMKKSAVIKYEELKHLLTDIDLSTRSAKYKQIYESNKTETDDRLAGKLLEFYHKMVIEKIYAINTQSYESIDLSRVDRDVAFIGDHYTVNSIIEAVYKINKYHAYSRTNVNNINLINANISVINVKTDLLEFYNYSNFL